MSKTDEKADDTVDYEDIDEDYDAPEVEAATEEDHLLSNKDYFSSNIVFASLNPKATKLGTSIYSFSDCFFSWKTSTKYAYLIC